MKAGFIGFVRPEMGDPYDVLARYAKVGVYRYGKRQHAA